MKLARALFAALIALAIGVGVQATTSSAASAACGICWGVSPDD